LANTRSCPSSDAAGWAWYRARDSVIGRDVALKVINDSSLNAPDVRERFLCEAVSAGRLSHENIATIYDVGEEDGRPYIMMEYVEGADLREMIRPGAPVTAEDKMYVAVQICQALHYAHRRGIIHRDIKPDNIRVSSDGRVKILDFGIARITDDTELQTITVTGMSIGSRATCRRNRSGAKSSTRAQTSSHSVLYCMSSSVERRRSRASA
jgi:serine/threonine-protein kinase